MNSTVTVQKNTIMDPNLATMLTSCFCSLTLCISIPATLSNIVNVYIFRTFKKIDSVNLCFLFLAAVDMFAMSILSVLSLFLLFKTLGFRWSINFVAHTYICSNAYGLLADIASATTTYIALQRGLCVALPFLTRHMFNRTKSAVVLAIITFFSVLCWFPKASFLSLAEIPHPFNRNETMIMIRFWDIWHTGYIIYQTFNKAFIGVTQYAIMLVCAIIIANGMRSSMRLKSSMSHTDDNTTTSANINKKASKSVTSADSKKEKDGKPHEQRSTKTGSKDAKEFLVIQQSFLVVLLTIVCTGPSSLCSIYIYFSQRGVREENSSENDFQEFNLMMYSAGYVLKAIDAFSNFFIYLRFNSKYRNQLYLTFNCKSENNDKILSQS